MGKNIDAYIVSLSKIKENIKNKLNNKEKDLSILDKALPLFAEETHQKGFFLIISNDLLDGSDSYSGLIEFIERFFGFQEGDGYDIVSDAQITHCYNNVSAEDVVWELEIELPDYKK